MEYCLECNSNNQTRVYQSETIEGVFRHLRSHKMTAQQYVLKWKYDGIAPKCKCGCENTPGWNIARRDFVEYVHGHHMSGRTRTDETRKKIGIKNSVNTTRWCQENPEKVRKKIDVMNASHKPDMYERVSASIHKFWSASPLAPELRKRASDRAVKLLGENKIGPQAPYKQENKFNPFTQQEERMHSSWESVFLDTCIKDKYPVTKDHKITIPYVDESGIERQYIPDFYAFEDRTLYEIKGFTTERDLLKWEAARQWCEQHGMQFVALQEMI